MTHVLLGEICISYVFINEKNNFKGTKLKFCRYDIFVLHNKILKFYKDIYFYKDIPIIDILIQNVNI